MDDTKKDRVNAINFATEAYSKVKHNRSYALPPQEQIKLAALGRAMNQKRAVEGRNRPDSQPSPWQEFFDLVEKLNAAGCNLVQARPSDPPPTPRPWLDPVTGAALLNPFAKSSLDLKAQSILAKRDPELAAHFKAMAEDPYGTIARMQDAEAARIAMEQVPYTKLEHDFNPFKNDKDLAGKNVLIKPSSPALVEFYRSEANPATIPLFGSSRNITVEGQLAKDPSTLALLRTAQAIFETWRHTDRQEAEERRQAAESEIKRLETVAA